MNKVLEAPHASSWCEAARLAGGGQFCLRWSIITYHNSTRILPRLWLFLVVFDVLRGLRLTQVPWHRNWMVTEMFPLWDEPIDEPIPAITEWKCIGWLGSLDVWSYQHQVIKLLQIVGLLRKMLILPKKRDIWTLESQILPKNKKNIWLGELGSIFRQKSRCLQILDLDPAETDLENFEPEKRPGFEWSLEDDGDLYREWKRIGMWFRMMDDIFLRLEEKKMNLIMTSRCDVTGMMGIGFWKSPHSHVITAIFRLVSMI